MFICYAYINAYLCIKIWDFHFQNIQITWLVKRETLYRKLNVIHQTLKVCACYKCMSVFCCCCSSKKYGCGRPLQQHRIRQLGESRSGLDLHSWRNLRFVQWQDHELSPIITSTISTSAMWTQLSVCTCSKTLCLSWCNITDIANNFVTVLLSFLFVPE